MKIGFSFGRCVRDIVQGTVDSNDVLCIIARTHMPDEQAVEWVVSEYLTRRSYLLGLDEKRCLEVGLDLFRSGRILEPRANGINVMQVPKEFIWMDLFPTVVDVPNQGVQMAWEQYRMLIGLTAQLPEVGETMVYQHGEKHIETPESIEEQRKAAELLARFI